MTWALALVLAKPPVTVLPNLVTDRVTLAAVVPRASGPDWVWRSMRESLALGTVGYTRDQLAQFTSLAGAGLRVSLGTDHLAVTFSVPRNSLSVGADVLAGLLSQPLFPEEDMQRIFEELPFRPREPWAAAIERRVLSSSTLTRSNFDAESKPLLNPELMRVVVGGPVSAEAAVTEVHSRWADWEAPRRRPTRPEAPTLRKRHGMPLATVSYLAKPQSSVPTMLLAALALGTGKEAVVWRVFREELRLSYRQEAFLVPDFEGKLRLQVLFASRPREGLATSVEEGLKKMQAAVEGWGEADLNRARQMARLTLETGVLPIPIVLTDRTLSVTAEDEAHLAAYGLLRYETAFRFGGLLEDCLSVDLETLKSAARAALKEPEIEIMEGS